MIIELILSPLFSLISFLINLIPSFNSVTNKTAVKFYDFMEIGLYFFGSSAFCLVIASVVSWSLVHFGWSIIVWLYKKVPGVN